MKTKTYVIITFILLSFFACNNKQLKINEDIETLNQEAFNNRYSDINFSKNQAKKAIHLLDSLRDKDGLPEDYYNNEKAKAWNTLAYAYFLTSDFDSASVYIDCVLKMPDNFNNKKFEEAIANLIEARLLLREYKYEDVFRIYNDIESIFINPLKIPQYSKDKEERYYWAKSEYLLGNVRLRYYYRNGYDLKNILPYLQKAEQDTSYIDTFQQSYLCYLYAGTYERFINSDAKNLIRALQYVEKGFNLLSNPKIQNNYFLADNYQMLGEILINGSTKLIMQGKDSIKVNEKIDKIKNNYLESKFNWSKEDVVCDSFTLILFKKAEMLFSKYNDPYQNITAGLFIADYYLNAKDTIKAREYYIKCLEKDNKSNANLQLGKWRYDIYQGLLKTITDKDGIKERREWFGKLLEEQDKIKKDADLDYKARLLEIENAEKDKVKLKFVIIPAIFFIIIVIVTVAKIFERKKLKEDKMIRSTLEIANDIGLKIITSSKDIETVNEKVAIQLLINDIYAEFHELFKMDVLTVNLFDKDNDKLSFSYSLKDGEGDTLSSESVPIYAEDREKSIGIISIQSFRENAFSDYDRLLLKTISSHVAIALNNMLHAINIMEDKAISDTCFSIMRHDMSPLLKNYMPDCLKTLRNGIINNSPKTLQQVDFTIEVFNRLKRVYDTIPVGTKLRANKLLFKCSDFYIQNIFDTLKEDNNTVVFFESSAYKVKADKALVEILLRNLIQNAKNAIKNRENGKIEVSASEYNGKFIKISVVDNGIGIAPDKLEGLFNMENDTFIKEHPDKASGFGLVLCRYIIQEHDENTIRGCKIWAESIEGQGSSFHFTLAKQ